MFLLSTSTHTHRNTHISAHVVFVRRAMALRTHSASEPPGRTLGTVENMAFTEIKETQALLQWNCTSRLRSRGSLLLPVRNKLVGSQHG